MFPRFRRAEALFGWTPRTRSRQFADRLAALAPAAFVGVESDEGPESGRILRVSRQDPFVRLDRLALPSEPDQAGSPAVQGDRVPGVEAKRLLVDREGGVVGT